MNKKILVMVVALLVCSMTLTPFALAKPWNERNNDKFQAFSTTLVPNLGNIIAAVANPEYIPSEDNYNKVIYSWLEEPMTAYTITVEGVGTYSLGTDFAYTGVAVSTQIGAPFTPNPAMFNMLIGSKAQKFRVDYMYDFGPDDGDPETIDGTLEMLAITAKEGVMHIRSLRGTGDLQNVQIQATGAEVGLGHIGVVKGWPDMPPETP